MIRKYGLLLAALVLVLLSCDQERDPCLQPTSVYMRIRARQHLTDTTTSDTLLPNPRWIAIDSGTVISFGKKVAGFSLTLNPLADTARYAVQPDSAVSSFDTLTFYYDKRLQFLSNACGYTYFYTLHQVRSTQHNIDSLRLQNGDVNSNVNTADHVQIFF